MLCVQELNSLLSVHVRYVLQNERIGTYLCAHVNSTQLCEKLQSGMIEHRNYSALDNLTCSQFPIFQNEHTHKKLAGDFIFCVLLSVSEIMNQNPLSALAKLQCCLYTSFECAIP